MPGPTRRSRSPQPRDQTIRVSLSTAEKVSIEAAAAASGMAAAAWLGDVGVAAAAQGPRPVGSWGDAMRELMLLRGEVADTRRVLALAGSNLNQLARVANSTGEVHAGATTRVAAMVARAVERVESVVDQVDAMTSDARRERLRGGA